MGKLLVAIGVVLVGVGGLMMLGIPFGRLPGDIVIRRGTLTLFLPIATSIVLSVVLTVLLTLLRR